MAQPICFRNEVVFDFDSFMLIIPQHRLMLVYTWTYELLVYTWIYEKPSTVSQQVFFWTNYIKLEYVVIYIVYYKAIYHPEHSMLYITNVIQVHNP